MSMENPIIKNKFNLLIASAAAHYFDLLRSLKEQACWHAEMPIKILEKEDHIARFDIKYVYFVFADDLLTAIAIFRSDSFTAPIAIFLIFAFILKTATYTICHVTDFSLFRIAENSKGSKNILTATELLVYF